MVIKYIVKVGVCKYLIEALKSSRKCDEYKLYLNSLKDKKHRIFFASCNTLSNIEKTIQLHFGFKGEIERII